MNDQGFAFASLVLFLGGLIWWRDQHGRNWSQ